MGKYYHDGNSVWTRVYIGTDENGKKKLKRLTAPNEKLLDKKVKQFRLENEINLCHGSGFEPLKHWVDKYLESLQLEVDCGYFSESDYTTAKSRLNYFLAYKKGILAKAKLKDILAPHIQPCILDLFRYNPKTGKPTAKRTLQRYLLALHNVFEFARKQRAYNYANPCDDVKIPKQAVQIKRTALTQHTIKLILTTEHRAKLAACIMMLAGLRRGEATALKWDDIDFDNRTIYVEKSYDFKNGLTKDTKTEAGMRKIIINDFLLDMLKNAYENRDTTNKFNSQFVIQKAKGGRMTETAWKRMFEIYNEFLRAEAMEYYLHNKVKKEDRYEPFTIHQLRHTYCSMLQWSGVDMKTAQELMGHSEIDVTANTYTHVNTNSKERAAELQSNYLKEFFLD